MHTARLPKGTPSINSHASQEEPKTREIRVSTRITIKNGVINLLYFLFLILASI